MVAAPLNSICSIEKSGNMNRKNKLKKDTASLKFERTRNREQNKKISVIYVYIEIFVSNSCLQELYFLQMSGQKNFIRIEYGAKT